MTNNSKIGGVLSIVSGAFGILWLLFFIGIGVVMLLIPRFDASFRSADTPEALFAVMAAFYMVIGLFYAIVGALAIVGGVFALKKRHWAWALAGSIAGTVVFMPCGIPAIIFIAMGKPEFQSAAPPAAAPTPTIQG
jgi:hypothetical protein